MVFIYFPDAIYQCRAKLRTCYKKFYAAANSFFFQCALCLDRSKMKPGNGWW